MLGKDKYNPIAAEWKRKYNSQTDDVRQKIDEIDKMPAKELQLRVIKKTKPEIRDGDVFVLSPANGIYFYGKVLKANIDHIKKDTFVHGKHVVFIFNCQSRELSIDNFKPDYSNLIISPVIVDISYWNKGLFYNVGNDGISQIERNLDYGFLKIGIKSNYFCKEDGTKLDREPKILGNHGISTITGVASKIRKELIMNPAILSDDE